MIANAYRVKAYDAIEKGAPVAVHLAERNGVDFNVVKHMTWFIGALAEELASGGNR